MKLIGTSIIALFLVGYLGFAIGDAHYDSLGHTELYRKNLQQCGLHFEDCKVKCLQELGSGTELTKLKTECVAFSEAIGEYWVSQQEEFHIEEDQ